MNVEQRLRELEKIQRPFSHPFPATEGSGYLIDSTFAFRVVDFYASGQLIVAFVADMQLPILREHARKDYDGQHEMGIGLLVLAFTLVQRVVYLGDKYKFSLGKDRDCFQLQSANPINFEPVPKNTNIKAFKALVAQRISSTNT